MSSKPSQIDAKVQAALNKRLIETGDWDRITKALERYLIEQGIEDKMKIRAEEIVRGQEDPTLRLLKEELMKSARGMIPLEIEKAVKQEIVAALEKQLQ